jgi:hypothetical protein
MIIIPAILESYRSLKDKTLKITFDCNELTPEQTMGVAGSLQQFGYLAFKNEPFKNNEKEVLNNLKADFEDTGKTPSQRLRGVLYVSWEQKNEGYKTFTDYYNAKMESLISHFKQKLDA